MRPTLQKRRLTSLLLLALCMPPSTRYFAMALTQVFADTSRKPKVCVVGAGAAGLAVARVFQRAGMEDIIVLEKDTEIGGVWNYHAGATDRPMYRGLRTNLPKEVMGYREFPFPVDTSKSFLTHREVFGYLKAYKNHFDLPVQFGCCVRKLQVLEGTASCVAHPREDQPFPKIQIEWTRDNSNSQQTIKDTFDAVIIANGHYRLPQIPQIPGMEHFQGETFHSIQYDDPAMFHGKRVLCIGGRASGADIAREIAQAGAAHVYVSDSAKEDGKVANLGDKLSWVPATVGMRQDGSLEFDLDCDIHPTVDVVVYCTGYDYNFPFIDETSNLPLTAVQRQVKPLYEQLWHAHYPNIAFVGLPHSVVPFPLFELQAEACLAQMADCTLPNRMKRIEHAENAQGGEGKAQGRVQDTHYLGNKQWDYATRMAKYAGVFNEKVETFLAINKKLYDHTGSIRKNEFPAGPDTYREYVYSRDDENADFIIVRTPVKDVQNVE